MSSVLDYMFISSKALAQVVLIGFCGYVFARQGVLTKSILKNLSVMNLNLFTPALLFSKMVDTLDPVMLLELWTEPVIYLLYGFTSLLWSRTGRKALGLPEDYGKLLDVATFFSNANTLPVSLIKSIALSSGAAFLLNGPNDTKEKVAARGISYAMIFATMNNILRWSLGMWIMGEDTSSNNKKKLQTLPIHTINSTPGSRYWGSSSGSTTTICSQTGSGPEEEAEQSHFLSVPQSKANSSRRAQVVDIDENTELLSAVHGPNAGYPSYDDGSDDSSDSSANASLTQDLSTFSPTPEPEPTLASRVTNLFKSAWASVSPFLNAPVYAIICAFVVICIPPLQAKFENTDSLFYTLWATVDMCGDACVPIVLISLGGQLGIVEQKRTASTLANNSNSTESDNQQQSATEASIEQSPEVTTTGPRPIPTSISISNTESLMASSAMQNRGIIVVLAGRFIFTPTVAVCLLTFLRVYLPTAIPLLVEDPIFMLTLLILSACPPAVNLITVTQALGKYEDEAAKILLWGYLLGILVLAFEFSGFLWLVNTLKV